jgi:hypothetical protein
MHLPKTAIYIACKIPHFTKNYETAIRNQYFFSFDEVWNIKKSGVVLAGVVVA